MRNPFSKVRIVKPKTSLFDLSHEVKMSCKASKIYPILLEEIVPGDSFQVSSEIFLRIAPLIAPIMHRINVYVHYFFVPNRLVWENWETFISDETDSLVVPYWSYSFAKKANYPKGGLMDYFGVQPLDDATAGTGQNISGLIPRGYWKIFNDYYADQIDGMTVNYTGDTCSSTEMNAYDELATRYWEKDYFTSALPWTEEGGAAVSVPGTIDYLSPSLLRKTSDGTVDPSQDVTTNASGYTYGSEAGYIDNIEGVDIDIAELRNSMRLQEWLEKTARAGSRYIEVILSHFGVKSDDARLQRAEYLGGGVQPISISEVVNTSATATEEQGNMAGHGISVGRSNQFKKYFKEHGYVFGLMSILPKTCYQQGIPRTFLREEKLDFFWPEFAHIGDQAIKDPEIYIWSGATTAVAAGAGTFGYQQRYAEYKSRLDRVAGDFRDDFNHWHCGRIFADEPTINNTFKQSNDDGIERCLAVQDGSDYFWVDIYNHVRAIRPMPYFSDPRT